jgi:uncharacterized membrane protein YbhN (UPF0104 family)
MRTAQSSDPADSLTASRRRQLLRLLIVAVCVAALAWTIVSLGPRRVLDVALRADPLWLALSILPLAGRFLIWAFKWRRMLARRSPVPYRFCLRALAAGSFVNLTTPTAKLAGGFVRAALLHRRHGWGMATAYGWSMADQVTNVLGHLLLYGLLAPVAALGFPPGPERSVLLGSGLLVLGGIVLSVALRGTAWRLLARPAFSGRFGRLLPVTWRGEEREDGDRGAGVREILRPLLLEGGAWRTFLPDLAWAAVAFGAVCVANALVFRALGADAPIAQLSIVVVLGYFAGVAVGAWGGVGVTEAALTGLYIQIGVPPDLAAAGTLLHRALFYAVVLGWGGAALLMENRR